MGNDGGIIKAICRAGNARAVSVTAAYIAPDEPREGKISLVGVFVAAVFPAVAARADAALVAVDAVALEEVANWDTRRG